MIPKASDTIFAPCTPPGKSGVAVVRVSGTLVPDIVRALASPSLPPARKLVHRKLSDPHSGDRVDDALVVHFPAPHSFTGEDVAEFHLHGSRAVLAALLDALSGFPGARMAEAGEFARRAFDNGKLDLSRLEGLADLIDSETSAQRKQALRLLSGHNEQVFSRLRTQMLGALATLEGALDFADESDVPAEAMGQVRELTEGMAQDISRWLAAAPFSERLREGFVVAIAGPPNVGKSSLVNAIARREVAIVSDIPGTTRDAIEVMVDIGGLSVLFIDTAGIRDSSDPIEAMGIARAKEAIARADMTILMTDPASLPFPLPPVSGSGKFLHVINKADLFPTAPKSAIGNAGFYISIKDNNGINELLGYIQKEFFAHSELPEAPIVARARHRRELENCLAHLRQASQVALPELMAEELRMASQAMGRLTGQVTPEEVLDTLFSRFCIGK